MNANETAEKLFASTESDQLRNQSITKLMHPIEQNMDLQKLSEFTFVFRNCAGMQWDGKIQVVEQNPETGDRILSLPKHSETSKIVEGSLQLKEKISILIVEDLKACISSIQRNLHKLGFKPDQIDVAEDGEMGVTAAKLRAYSFIIMDNQMPNKYGIAATKEIREFEKVEGRARSAILFDSSSTEFVYLKEPNEEKEAEARAARKEVLSRDLFDDFIPKPILTQPMKKFLVDHWPKV